ncbi:MAG: hypothetical protein P4M09_21745 [Devosia sp.]|nr:hypothetical protein [Devosia sp.]
MSAVDVFIAAMAEAMQPGPVGVPDALLALLEAQADPFRALTDRDTGNEIFAAIRSQFGFVDFVRASGKPPSAEDFGKLVGLLRWVVREGADWEAAADPKRARLMALFVTVQFASMGANFWTAAPDKMKPNDRMLAALQSLMAGMKSNFTIRGLPAPIWEAEAVERFQKADAESDWVEIAQGWRLIEDSFFPGVAVAQAAQCLNRFVPERLVQAVSDLRETGPIMSVVLPLDPVAALRLGSASDNPHVQFAAAYRAVSPKANNEALGEVGEGLHAQLLAKVTNDPPRWAAWMRIFNFFPSQFPALQAPLGRVLADADETALRAYVEAISLHWSGQQTRLSVADCLRIFRAEATVEQRQVLWHLAYRRWKEWRFGLSEVGANHANISRSELDYAVVGYALECLDDAHRQDMLDSLWQKLQTVEDAWYPEITSLLSAWNAILSEMQPFCLAMSIVGTEADWIEPGTFRLPFDPEKEPYVTLKYGRPKFA